LKGRSSDCELMSCELKLRQLGYEAYMVYKGNPHFIPDEVVVECDCDIDFSPPGYLDWIRKDDDREDVILWHATIHPIGDPETKLETLTKWLLYINDLKHVNSITI
jgi:hypothetical protein